MQVMKPVVLGVSILSLLIASESIAPLGKYTPVERRHWAFVARSQPAIPTFTLAADRAWARNPVDAFILQRLKKEDLRPSPQADRATLIRRLYFDLTGVAPAPGDVAPFAAAKSPPAYSQMVEHLLNRRRYR